MLRDVDESEGELAIRLVFSVHGEVRKHAPRRVFRLPDHPTCRAFPGLVAQWRTCGVRSRLRRRVRDGFSPSSRPASLCALRAVSSEPDNLVGCVMLLGRLGVNRDSGD